MKMLETIHILPVRAESAAPAPLRGKKLDQRAVLQVVRKVDWKKSPEQIPVRAIFCSPLALSPSAW